MEVYKKNDRIIVIDYDDCPESPRRDWRNAFTFLGWHSRYDSPDENNIGDLEDVCELVGVSSPANFDKSRTHVVFTVSMLDHTLLHFSLSKYFRNSIGDPWDSGIFGVMIAKRKDLRECYGVKRLNMKKVFHDAECELETYEQYCNGDVYCYTEYSWDKTLKCLNAEDSCYGYFGFKTVLDDRGLTSDDYAGNYRTDESIERAIKSGNIQL